ATSGLHIERMIVRDTSLESHLFASSTPKGHLASLIRKSLLKLNETLATRLFTFHVGALRHK
ncbi:MAG: class I SAM-dependent methyltransferase, partial [Pseudomonadota bacterium]